MTKKQFRQALGDLIFKASECKQMTPADAVEEICMVHVNILEAFLYSTIMEDRAECKEAILKILDSQRKHMEDFEPPPHNNRDSDNPLEEDSNDDLW